MNYYPWHIGDYLTATVHLSWLEDAAYRRLLDVYYSREKPLPSDLAQACRLVRAVSDEERAAVETVLNEFFTASPKGWRHKRADAELDKARAAADRSRENGRRGGRKPKSAPVKEISETEPVDSMNPDETQQVISGFVAETQPVDSGLAPKTKTKTKTNTNVFPDGNTSPAVADVGEVVSPKPKPKPKPKSEAPDLFFDAWAAYPKRPGHSKAGALRAWSARVKAGESPEDMLAGVRRYAAYCQVVGTEPQFVKHASTFFGPDRHYLDDWTPPKVVKAAHKHAAAFSAIYRACGDNPAPAVDGIQPETIDVEAVVR